MPVEEVSVTRRHSWLLGLSLFCISPRIMQQAFVDMENMFELHEEKSEVTTAFKNLPSMKLLLLWRGWRIGLQFCLSMRQI